MMLAIVSLMILIPSGVLFVYFDINLPPEKKKKWRVYAHILFCGAGMLMAIVSGIIALIYLNEGLGSTSWYASDLSYTVMSTSLVHRYMSYVWLAFSGIVLLYALLAMTGNKISPGNEVKGYDRIRALVTRRSYNTFLVMWTIITIVVTATGVAVDALKAEELRTFPQAPWAVTIVSCVLTVGALGAAWYAYKFGAMENLRNNPECNRRTLYSKGVAEVSQSLAAQGVNVNMNPMIYATPQNNTMQQQAMLLQMQQMQLQMAEQQRRLSELTGSPTATGYPVASAPEAPTEIHPAVVAAGAGAGGGAGSSPGLSPEAERARKLLRKESKKYAKWTKKTGRDGPRRDNY